VDGGATEFEEGIRCQAERSFFHRNPHLAEEAKRQYGCKCQACGFDFVSAYGELGDNFAEVHHLNPLSERPSEEWTKEILSSVADVAVLCANCHRMIHRRKPALSIDQLKAILLEPSSN
jgi:5-methylcytosine-specific restriction protein A